MYYFNLLSENEKNIYKNILQSIKLLRSRLSIAGDKKRALEIYEYVIMDNPHICYIDPVKAEWLDGIFHTEICFNYLWPAKECRDRQQKFDLKVASVARELELYTMEEEDKELYIHDFITDTVQYDYGKNGEISYSAYGALMNGAAVCQGISALYKVFADKCSLNCILIRGWLKNNNSTMQAENHQWNIVEVNGRYAHLDVTNDKNRLQGIKLYGKYNFTDTMAYEFGYSWNNKEFYPKCEADELYYYRKRRMIVSSETELRKFVSLRKKRKINIMLISRDYMILNECGCNKIIGIISSEISKGMQYVKIQCAYSIEGFFCYRVGE